MFCHDQVCETGPWRRRVGSIARLPWSGFRLRLRRVPGPSDDVTAHLHQHSLPHELERSLMHEKSLLFRSAIMRRLIYEQLRVIDEVVPHIINVHDLLLLLTLLEADGVIATLETHFLRWNIIVLLLEPSCDLLCAFVVAPYAEQPSRARR